MDTKEDNDMAVLAKPSNRAIMIQAEKSKDFLEQFNKSVVSKDFLKTCKKAGNLFQEKKEKK